MTPAGTRVTWFVLGVCVGVLLAVVGMAGIADAETLPRNQKALPESHSRSFLAGVESNQPVEGRGLIPSPMTTGGEASQELRTSVELDRETGAPSTLSPTAELAGPLTHAEATWCAPTPKYCGGWGNGRLLGAVHSFRWGDPEYAVRVSRGSRSVVVRVVSFCACLGRDDTIDLSTEAFSRLAPLSRGRITVELEGVR